jgi:hypothetical protein
MEPVKPIEDLIQASGRAPMPQSAYNRKTQRVFDKPHGCAQPETTSYPKEKHAKRCAYIEARPESLRRFRELHVMLLP